MIKKKLNILLLLSLVLLFISLLGTTSYAREFTQTELKNFMNNYVDNFYNGTNYKTLYKQRIADMDLTGWVDGIRGKQGTYLLMAYGSGQYLYFYYFCWRPNNNNYAYISTQNGAHVITTHDTSIQFRNYFSLSQNILTYDQNNLFIDNNTENLLYYYYIDGVIYNTSNKEFVVYGPNEYKPNETIFNSSYVPTPISYFDIDINADFRNNKATISNDTSGTEYYLIPYTSNKVRIGNMFDYSNLAAVIKRKFRYKQSTRSFDLIREYQANTNNLEFFDIADDILIVFEYCQPDTTEFITFVPKADTGFSQFTVPIYYTSANTKIVNGVIDTGDTFSGDNYTNYNNDTNTDKIIDNTNDDSNVDNIINEQLSGDVNDFASKVGYNPIQNPFIHVIEFLLNGICNTVLGSGDVTLDFSFRGVNWVLDSSDLVTPTNALTNFMGVLLSALYVFAFYKYGFHVYEKLQEGDITSVINSSHDDNNWRYM